MDKKSKSKQPINCGVIGMFQVKGGSGRSTLATNLSGALAERGRVLLVDCDMPQGTSASWAAMRESWKGEGGNPSDVQSEQATTHAELVALVEDNRSAFDFIVLDSPPRTAEVSRAVLILSDLALVPVGASAAEIWASGDMLETIEAAEAVNPDLKVRLVWTRFRGYTRSAQEISAAAGRELGLKALKTKLGLRVAYPEALAAGMTAAEYGDKAAREEVEALTKEVVRLLK